MKYNSLNRRMFLQGSLGMMAIPLLPSLLPSKAQAAVNVPSKFIHFSSHYGLPREYVIPSYLNPNAVPWTQKETYVKTQSLVELAKKNGTISRMIDDQFNPYLQKLNVITNAHLYTGNAGANHSKSNQSTCSNQSSDNGGPLSGYYYSVDHVVEQALNDKALRVNLCQDGIDFYIPSVSFGTVNGKEVEINMDKTLAAFNQSLGGGQTSTSTSQADQVSINRRSLVDSVLGDFTRLKNHRRVSADDKNRLENAVQLWREYEKGLSKSQTITCTIPALNMSSKDWGVIHRTALDGIALAFACGRSRTAAYNIRQCGDIDLDGGYTHSMHHDFRNQKGGQNSFEFVDSLRWQLHLYTYFLGRLSSLTDANQQNLLESSIASFAYEYSTWGHESLGHTLLVAGGGNGKLETGLHVDAGGAPVNKFHITNMMAAGLSLAQIERNGRKGWGEYSLAGGGDSKDVSFGRPGVERVYNSANRAFYFQDTEKQKPFFYLKA